MDNMTLNRYRELRPTDVPHVYVMTTAAFSILIDELQEDVARPPQFDPLRLCGIPVEHFATLREVWDRAESLASRGVRVAVVYQ